MEIVWGDRRFVLFKVLICVIAKLYNVHTLSTALHTEHDQQASRQSCVFHTKFQISYFFSCLWEKHWVFFNINSILVYTTFTCNLLCFFFSTVLLYCYRKFIFCFRFPWKYLSACGKNDFSPLLLLFFYPSFSPWAKCTGRKTKRWDIEPPA